MTPTEKKRDAMPDLDRRRSHKPVSVDEFLGSKQAHRRTTCRACLHRNRKNIEEDVWAYLNSDSLTPFTRFFRYYLRPKYGLGSDFRSVARHFANHVTGFDQENERHQLLLRGV